MPFRVFDVCPVHSFRGSVQGLAPGFGIPRCEVCDRPLAFVGWRLSGNERMGNRQFAYGLRPIGPWNELAGELLSPRRVSCRRCRGEGILTIDFDRWCDCPVCEGTGGLWTCPPDEVEALRTRILERYPEAEISFEGRDGS